MYYAALGGRGRESSTGREAAGVGLFIKMNYLGEIRLTDLLF